MVAIRAGGVQFVLYGLFCASGISQPIVEKGNSSCHALLNDTAKVTIAIIRDDADFDDACDQGPASPGPSTK